MKFGQHAPNGCEVTILSNDWNKNYCYRCISTFQLFKYPQKLNNMCEKIMGQIYVVDFIKVGSKYSRMSGVVS